MEEDKIRVHQYYTINPIIWFRLLIENKGVAAHRIRQAITITFFSLLTIPLQILDWLIFTCKKKESLKDPIFILGHWRSGTTHLHYVLSKDNQFGYLTYYQAFLPNIFFTGGQWLKKRLSPHIPNRRPQDNMEIQLDLPHEEENPMGNYCMQSASHSFFFPTNEKYYEDYILFKNTSKQKKDTWKKRYHRLLTKISMAYDYKPLLIKNPHNTGRVRELLELFPNAKFIHIHRHAEDVIPSTYLMYDYVVKTQYLQTYSPHQTMDKIFYYYRSLMGKFFSEKSLIKNENFFEVKFEDFEKNPMQIIHNLYSKFDLTLSEQAKTDMEKYIHSKQSYKKNKHNVSPELKNRIRKECSFAMEKLGYPNAITSH